MKILSAKVLCRLLVAVTILGGLFLTPGNASAADRFETRCGWFDNPTPGNVSLVDRDGEWIIGIQGMYEVEGEWEWPEFPPGQWVRTNGYHGYGCACLRVKVNRRTHKVLAIKGFRVRSLAQCQQDKSLEARKGNE